MATKKKDKDIVADVTEARRLCDPKVRKRVMRRDRALPCSRCGHPIDFTLSGRHPAGPTLDHRGLQVAQAVGMPRGEAKRRLNDITQLAISHRECNTRDSRGWDRPPGWTGPPPTAAPVNTGSLDWAARSLETT